MTTRFVLAGATAMLASAGCTAFFFERGSQPSGPDDPPVVCSSLAWPVIDAGFAITAGVGVATCKNDSCGLGALAAIPFAVLSGASSIFGVVEHERCERAAERQRASFVAPRASAP